MPAIAIAIFIIGRVGQKWLFCATFFCAGLACLCATFVEGQSHLMWLKITFVMIGKCRWIWALCENRSNCWVFAGKFTISAGNTIMPVYTAELYPTSIRNVGVGACNVAAGLALILTPYLDILVSFPHLSQWVVGRKLFCHDDSLIPLRWKSSFISSWPCWRRGVYSEASSWFSCPSTTTGTQVRAQSGTLTRKGEWMDGPWRDWGELNRDERWTLLPQKLSCMNGCYWWGAVSFSLSTILTITDEWPGVSNKMKSVQVVRRWFNKYEAYLYPCDKCIKCVYSLPKSTALVVFGGILFFKQQMGV